MISYNQDLIQTLIIQPPQFDTSLNERAGSNNLRLKIQASIPDPSLPGQVFVIRKFLRYPATTDISKVISNFQKDIPAISKKSGLLLKYNNILYESGTLESCHIQNDSTLTIIALENDKEATENEGFRFVYWALVPLLIAFSFLGAGLIGQFKMIYRAIYVLFATLIGVPSTIATVLGFYESFSDAMKAGIVGQYWFSPGCCSCCFYDCRCNSHHCINKNCCCCCCGKANEHVSSEIDINKLIEEMNNAMQNIDDRREDLSILNNSENLLQF